MGKHARGAARSRVPASSILLGTVIVAVIAVGSWLSSRAQPAPPAATDSASAVVVSSLACTDGAGGTLVDVQVPTGPPVRTSLDACGHQEGQLLAVSFPAGDPASAWVADRDPQDDAPISGVLVPIGIGITALVVLSVVMAVWLDSRRSRRARAAAHAAVEDDGLAGLLSLPTADAEPAEPAEPDEPESAGGRHALPEPTDAATPAAALEPAAASGADDRRQPAVDLAFPFGANLAASLHDELFTHRGVTT